MDIVDKARCFASEKHAGQFRKHGLRPYIYHPERVVEYLRSKRYDDPDLLCAAWLHDTVEDCPDVSYTLLREEFGPAVADLVREVSHAPVDSKLKRSERWQIYLRHYESASADGQTLKLSDRVQNLQEYVDYWDEVPPKGRLFLQRVYLDESIDLVEGLQLADRRIYTDLIHVVNYLDELCSEEF